MAVPEEIKDLSERQLRALIATAGTSSVDYTSTHTHTYYTHTHIHIHIPDSLMLDLNF